MTAGSTNVVLVVLNMALGSGIIHAGGNRHNEIAMKLRMECAGEQNRKEIPLATGALGMTDSELAKNLRRCLRARWRDVFGCSRRGE